jgi:hypothetical protein
MHIYKYEKVYPGQGFLHGLKNIAWIGQCWSFLSDASHTTQSTHGIVNRMILSETILNLVELEFTWAEITVCNRINVHRKIIN